MYYYLKVTSLIELTSCFKLGPLSYLYFTVLLVYFILGILYLTLLPVYFIFVFYSCVYKCVCKQFSEKLYADLMAHMAGHLEKLNEQLKSLVMI